MTTETTNAAAMLIVRESVIARRRAVHPRPSLERTQSSIKEISGRGRLRAIWSLVQSPENWKQPVDSVILACEATADEVRQAVAYYTGSAADVTPCRVAVRHPRGLVEFLAPALLVRAPGYYATIGA